MVKEFFSHDYNTRLDDKIKSLIVRHGYLGYGIFWGLVEDLYNNKNSLSLNYDAIAFEYRVDKEIIKSIINDFGLFKKNDKKFFSTSIKARLKIRDEKSTKARNAILARWNKDTNVSKNDTNVIQDGYERNTIKEKKSKVNNNKEKGIKDFVPPSLQDVINYFKENNYSAAAAKKAFDYYTAGNWKDSGGKPVKSWKQKMISVWFKPENEEVSQKQLSLDDQLGAKL